MLGWFALSDPVRVPEMLFAVSVAEGPRTIEPFTVKVWLTVKLPGVVKVCPVVPIETIPSRVVIFGCDALRELIVPLNPCVTMRVPLQVVFTESAPNEVSPVIVVIEFCEVCFIVAVISLAVTL